MKFLLSCLAAIAVVSGAGLCFASPALAQTYVVSPGVAAGVVQVPWGDWVADFAQGALGISALIVTFLVRKLPKPAYLLAQQWRVNELLNKAVTFGINATSNAVKGKTLDINTGNTVVAMAAEYAISHAPELVENIGLKQLREKILARIDLDDTAELPAPAGTIPQ